MKLEKLRISKCNELMRGWEQGRCGSRLLKRPFRHSMTEGGTHCNVAGHVVPATVVSWFAPSFSVLRGTTPGAFRRITRKSMPTACTRTTQVRGMRQQARHEVTLWHSMMEGGTHCNVVGHVVPAMLVSWFP